MENNKRIVLSLVLVAIIAIAAVGAGYAYTAITTNSDNSASVEYIALKQVAAGNEATQQGQYNFSSGDKVDWNTKDYRTGTDPSYTYNTEYRLNGTVQSFDQEYITVPIGKTFKITASPESERTATVIAPLTCTISTVNFNTPTISGYSGQFYFFVKITVGSTEPQTFKIVNDDVKKWNSTSSLWEDSTFQITKQAEANAYEDTLVEVFFGLAASADCITISNVDNSPRLLSAAPLTNASLSFRASTTSAEIPVTGVTITGDSAVTVGNEITLTATVSPNGATTGTVYWSSSDTSKATVMNGTVKGIAAGTVIITVTTLDGAFTDTKEITVS